MSNISDKIKSFPQSPGVYLFKNRDGGIIYVGKAASLKDRVGSYFQHKNGAARPIEIFISEVKDVETRNTDTVLEAYILEQNLIKEYQPKYNAMGKDDRSFCYVIVTKEVFPRFLVLRATEMAQISNSPNYLISNKIPNSKLQIPNKLQNLKSKLLKNVETELVFPRKGQARGLSPQKIPYSKIYGPYTSRRQIETVLKILRKIFPYH
ncbi:MAG TPA: GIY-YIG nuclease family protein, partial [Patescibacteria group bacterium]|nr:GIY-YIG nuclease family protein [Patescibacteria group bacterium]